ncbi:MAG: C40 family peptidase [Flavobacteriales bacterium]|nr:C40 family peptidase [Flavobacteriales bacterium]
MEKYQVITPLVPVRSEPRDPAEQVTQFLYGEQVEVLEEHAQWRRCRSMQDGYEGWLDSKMIGEIQLGEYLVKSPMKAVSLPSGVKVVPAGSRIAEELGETKLESISQVAKMFLGAPYLWGGKSIMGIDCSGLTQVASQLVGIQLPRDARDQAQVGEEIPFADLAEENDLAFFDNEDGNIIHVGVILENDVQRFIIHAAGEVRIDRFDHQGIFREDQQRYTHKLRIIRRVNG